jgi:hypothetical protein
VKRGHRTFPSSSGRWHAAAATVPRVTLR